MSQQHKLNARIVLRTDTSANYAANFSDRVLLKGEVAVISNDVGDYSFKIGDGETPFDELPYVHDLTLSGEISQKSSVYIDDSHVSAFNIHKVTADEYHELVITDTVDPNSLYIISSDTINAYGERIENVADPISATDAATMGYVVGQFGNLSISYSDDRIRLSYAENEIASFDASEFVVDGMLLSAGIIDNNLVLQFNTDAGQNDVSVDLAKYIDAYTAGYGLCVENNKFSIDTNVVVELTTVNELAEDLCSAISAKINVDGENVDTLSVINIPADEYHDLVTTGQVDPHSIYVVSSDEMNMYGEKITNLAPGTDLSDAVNFEQLSALNEKVDNNRHFEDHRMHDFQVICPKVDSKNLFIRVYLYASQDMTEAVLSADSKTDSEYFAAFFNTGETIRWITPSELGLGAEFANYPVLVKLTNLLRDNGHESTYSQLFISYEWYHTIDSEDVVSDKYSIVVPSYTEVGANASDYVTKSQYEDIAAEVRKDSYTPELNDYDQYVCYSYKTNIFSEPLSGTVDILLDDFSKNKEYGIKFTAGDDLAFKFWYENGINGQEFDDSWNINSGHKFKSGSTYLIKIRQDMIEVVGPTFLDENISYKLVTLTVDSTETAICNIENRSITTVKISSSEIPVTINLPEPIEGYARDFILRIEITTATVPEIEFSGLDTDWMLESENAEALDMSPGVNIISFTEMV